MSLMLYSGLFFGVYVASVYKSIASGIPNEIGDKALTLTGAIGSVMNGSSRVIWATLQDKFGFNAIYMTVLTIQLVTALLIFHVRTNQFLYTLCVALAYTCEGGHFSMFPAAAVKIFGMDKGA